MNTIERKLVSVEGTESYWTGRTSRTMLGLEINENFEISLEKFTGPDLKVKELEKVLLLNSVFIDVARSYTNNKTRKNFIVENIANKYSLYNCKSNKTNIVFTYKNPAASLYVSCFDKVTLGFKMAIGDLIELLIAIDGNFINSLKLSLALHKLYDDDTKVKLTHKLGVQFITPKNELNKKISIYDTDMLVHKIEKEGLNIDDIEKILNNQDSINKLADLDFTGDYFEEESKRRISKNPRREEICNKQVVEDDEEDPWI